MRLIDADVLIELFAPYVSDDKKVAYQPRQLKIDDIKNATTVEAIPISFIEEQVKLCNEIGFRRGEECYMALIEKWRAENETD